MSITLFVYVTAALWAQLPLSCSAQDQLSNNTEAFDECRSVQSNCILHCLYKHMGVMDKDGWYQESGLLEKWIGFNFTSITPSQFKEIAAACKRVNNVTTTACRRGDALFVCFNQEYYRLRCELAAWSMTGLIKQLQSHEQPWSNHSCYVNMGPSCVLGPAPGVYPKRILKMLKERTDKCNKCSSKRRKVGVVCTMDKKTRVWQKMDFCVMKKMNCIGGVAVVESTGKTNEFGDIPFAIKPRWGRISVRGAEDAHIRFYDTWPYKPVHSYWVILNGLWGSLKTRLWQDERPPPKEIDNPYGLRGRHVWTEYTIVWNKTSGWFLMSQARDPNWRSRFHLDHVSRGGVPWNIKYVDVSGSRGFPLTWIFHDLPHDLKRVQESKCNEVMQLTHPDPEDSYGEY